MFRTHDPDADRLIAVKAFAIDLTPEQAAELAAILERLRHLEIAHAAVTAVIAAGVEDSVAYLAQQYVAGESLDAAVRQYGPAPPADAVRLISHVAAGLDAAAAVGLFHGALHPRDVLVTPGETHVTGLGVAAALEAVGHRAPIRRPYAAPERESGGEWGAPADVYALAAVSYEVLTGRRALPGTEQPLPGLSDVNAHDAAALNEAILAALDPDPERRPESAAAFAEAFASALLSGGREGGRSGGRSSRSRRHKPRSGRLPGLEDPLAPAAPTIDRSPSIQDGGETTAGAPEAVAEQGAGPEPSTGVPERAHMDGREDSGSAAAEEAGPDAPAGQLEPEADGPGPILEPVPEEPAMVDEAPPAQMAEADVADAAGEEALPAAPMVVAEDDRGEPEAFDAGSVSLVAEWDDGQAGLSDDHAAEPEAADPGSMDFPSEGAHAPEPDDPSLSAAEGEPPPEEVDLSSLGEVVDSLDEPSPSDAAVAEPADDVAEPDALVGLEDLDTEAESVDEPADVDLGDLQLSFTPQAGELQRAGLGPDLEALSKALEEAGEDPESAAEDVAPPDAAAVEAPDLEEAAEPEDASADAGSQLGFELTDGAEEAFEPVERPRTPPRETIDDYRDPGTLVTEPPVPRALAPGPGGRASRHFDYASDEAGRGRRRWPVAAGVVAALAVLLLAIYWAGGFSGWFGAAPAVPSAPEPSATAGAGEPSPSEPAGAAQPGTTVEVPPPPAGQASPPGAPPPTAPAAPAPATVAAPASGEIRVTSSPSTADVYVNGERRGVTPQNLRDLPLGTYTIRVSRPGYSTQERVVTVSPDAPNARVALTLPRLREAPAAPPKRPAATKPAPTPSRPPASPKAPSSAPGSISVETRPEQVRVFVDGRAVGLSPLVVPNVAPGRHEVRLELQGYRPWVATVTLTPGQRLRLTASLERAPAR